MPQPIDIIFLTPVMIATADFYLLANIPLLWISLAVGGLIGGWFLLKAFAKFREKEGLLTKEKVKFSELLEQLHVAVIVVNPQLEILLRNEAAKRLLDDVPETLLGATIFGPDWEIVNESGIPLAVEDRPLQQAIATKKPVKNVTLGVCLPSLFKPLWLSVNATPKLDKNGNIKQILCDLKNISEHKQIEAKFNQLKANLEHTIERRTYELQLTINHLQSEIKNRTQAESALHSERKFLNTLLNHLTDGILACDAEGEITVFNQALCKLYGLSNNPTTWNGNSNEYQLFYPNQNTPIEPPETPLYRALEGEVIRDLKVVVVPKDGKQRLLNVSGQAIVDSQGRKLGAVIALSDITAQSQQQQCLRQYQLELEALASQRTAQLRYINKQLKQEILERQEIEKALRHSEERYQIAVSGSKVGVWDWNLETDEIYVDPNLKAILGYEENEIANTWTAWADRIYPDDVESVIRAAKVHLSGQEPYYEIEHRMVHKDGSIRWFLSRGIALRNGDGKAIRLTGMETDITERKWTEEEWQKFFVLVENSNDLIAMFNLEGEVTYLNEAGRELVGWKNIEATTPKYFTHYLIGKKEGNAWESLLEKLLESDNYQQEIEICHLITRQQIYLQQSFFPVKHPKTGELICIATVQRDITERKQAEIALRESEERLNSILSSLDDSVWSMSLNPYQPVYFSDATERIFARPISEFWENPNLWLEVIHPDDRQRVESFSSDLFEMGSKDIEYRIVKPSGEIRWLRDRARLIRNSHNHPIRIDGIATDITERKTIESELEQERQHLRQIVTNAPVAMALFDKKMKYLAHSDQWLKDYCLENQDIINCHHADILPTLNEKYSDIYQQALQGNILSCSEDRFDCNGQTIYLRWAVQPWYKPDHQVGGIVVVTQVINELVTAREAALEASRMKSQFLANMSHEIRTPMNGVIGMTDLLLKTPLNPQQKDFANTLKISAQNLLLIINDVLDFSKLEAGEMRLEKFDLELNQCLEEVADLLAPQAQAKGLNLFTLIEPSVPLHLKGDAGRLRQILMNLAGNAVKFTDTGEVTIKVALASKSEDLITLYFEIQDTGIGICARDKQKLFQSFSQLDSSPTRQYGGTGLGLAICKQLVELMGGEIGVKSEPNQGSTFWFTATLERSHPPAKPSTLIVPQLEGKRVLLVDSHPTSYQIIHTYTAPWGLRTDVVTTPQEAIAALRQATNNGYPYDFCLIDLQNPELYGEMLGKVISFDRNLHLTKWLVMISWHQYPNLDRLLQYGASGYLCKPIKAKRLKTVLLNALQNFPVEIASTVSQRPTPNSSTLSNLKILLAEDTPINQTVIINQLQVLGCRQITTVNDGQQALESLESNEYDLVLMDCLMPILDGYQATQQLREREGSDRHTIVIAMTANAIKGERDKCLAVGMDDYISKPIQIDTLEAILQRWAGIITSNSPIPDSLPESSLPDTVPVKENPDDPAIVDFARLSEVSRGDREFERELLEAFLEDAPCYLQNIQKALEKGDFIKLAHSAHQLKGAASMVAIRQLPAIAAQLEQQARSSSFAELSDLTAQIGTLLADVKALVDQW
ncbi:MAG: PAS domain S-box protein [Chroococcales cyanobacterium]